LNSHLHECRSAATRAAAGFANLLASTDSHLHPPTHDAELALRSAVNELMARIGGAAAPGGPVASVKLYPDKAYAFLEFRSVEEASNAMALDGVRFRDAFLKVR
jgi:hypothetical protein